MELHHEPATLEAVRRYQWAQPGDMIHVDIKKLARFEWVGHRITGDRRKGCSPGAGHEKADMAVDDATSLPYIEVLPDEQKATTVATDLYGAGPESQTDQGLQAQAQRQGRAVHQAADFCEAVDAPG